MKNSYKITKKMKDCAREWCDSHARLIVSDCTDAYHETEQLRRR
jgi:hypothetical protein